MHGYILGVDAVLYMAGSLRYRRIDTCLNANSLECKSTLYTVSLCKIQLLTLIYRVEKAVLNTCILNIEYMASY